MSIYGPKSPPPPRATARGAAVTSSEAAAVVKVKVTIVLVVLLGLGLVAALAGSAFEKQQAKAELLDRLPWRSLDRAETIRRDIERSFEATRLESADLLGPIPEPPQIDIPAPLQTADVIHTR